ACCWTCRRVRRVSVLACPPLGRRSMERRGRVPPGHRRGPRRGHSPPVRHEEVHAEGAGEVVPAAAGQGRENRLREVLNWGASCANLPATGTLLVISCTRPAESAS